MTHLSHCHPRGARVADFLKQNNYSACHVQPLTQDASSRTYLRLGSPRPAVLMDASASQDLEPFLRIAEYLRRLGLSTPAIFDADVANGLLLEEDLGDDLLSVLLDRGEPPINLLDAAIDALTVLQRGRPLEGLPRWQAKQMVLAATSTLFDWWWPACFGGPAPEAARCDIGDALMVVLEVLGKGPNCMVHRDYFAGNLLWLASRSDVARIGIIDFQDMAVGHPAYDLVSLLQDARRDIPPELQRHCLERYLAGRPELNPVEFRAAFAACAAQRHLRVACQWVRLAVRDGRPRYLVHGPRTWRLLEEALSEDSVTPLSDAINRWIPRSLRHNPPALDSINACKGL